MPDKMRAQTEILQQHIDDFLKALIEAEGHGLDPALMPVFRETAISVMKLNNEIVELTKALGRGNGKG